MTFLIGLLAGIILSAIALVWDASRDKPQLVWMDENYKIHLVKRGRAHKYGTSIRKGDIIFYDADSMEKYIPPKKKEE